MYMKTNVNVTRNRPPSLGRLTFSLSNCIKYDKCPVYATCIPRETFLYCQTLVLSNKQSKWSLRTEKKAFISTLLFNKLIRKINKKHWSLRTLGIYWKFIFLQDIRYQNILGAGDIGSKDAFSSSSQSHLLPQWWASSREVKPSWGETWSAGWHPSVGSSLIYSPKTG